MVSIRKSSNSNEVPVKVVGGSFYGRYNKISTEKTYNMFKSTAGQDDEEQFIVNFPGYKKVLTLALTGSPTGVGRALFHSVRGNLMVAVVGSQVWSISSNLGATFIGNLNTTIGEVFCAENLNSQICIVDGQDAWIYNYSLPVPNLTLQTVDANLIPNYVDFHNTFFLFGNANTTASGAAWFVYEYATSTTISKVSQQTLQTKPDFAIAVQHIPGQSDNVLVFGTTVTEIQTQVGGLQNYVRQPTRNIDYGCVSPQTIAKSDTFVAWLAANEDNAPVIMIYDERGATQISTDGIDYTLSRVKFPAKSTANLFRIDGHLFYKLTFFAQEDNFTIIYDFNTKMFYNLSDQNLNHHPACQIVYFNLKLYFISLNNSSIYELNSDYTVIDDNIVSPGSADYDPLLVYDMQRLRVTPPIRQANSGRFIAHNLVVTLEQGTDPDYSGASALFHERSYIVTEDLSTVITNESGVPLVVEQDVIDANIGNNYLSRYVGSDIIYKPRVDLAISKDGGITWSPYASRDLHQLGNRKNILQWENMGQANDLCFKFRFWGTYRFIVNNAVVQVRSS